MTCLPIQPVDGSSQPLADYDPLSSILHSVMSRELREIGEKLESLAEVLVGDEHFTVNYLVQLQTFDLLIQHANECAGLLERIAEGADSADAISHVRLGAVQERLRLALIGG